MADLMTCANCNASISKEAKSCPKCGTFAQLGLKCNYCQQPVRPCDAVDKDRRPIDYKSEAYAPSNLYNYHLSSRYHLPCVEAVASKLPASVNCPACYVNLDLAIARQGTCPHCGQPIQTGIVRCSGCNLELHPEYHGQVYYPALTFHPECFVKRDCTYYSGGKTRGPNPNDEVEYTRVISPGHAIVEKHKFGKLPDQIRPPHLVLERQRALAGCSSMILIAAGVWLFTRMLLACGR